MACCEPLAPCAAAAAAAAPDSRAGSEADIAVADDAVEIAHTASAPMVFVTGNEGLIDARNFREEAVILITKLANVRMLIDSSGTTVIVAR